MPLPLQRWGGPSQLPPPPMLPFKFISTFPEPSQLQVEKPAFSFQGPWNSLLGDETIHPFMAGPSARVVSASPDPPDKICRPPKREEDAWPLGAILGTHLPLSAPLSGKAMCMPPFHSASPLSSSSRSPFYAHPLPPSPASCQPLLQWGKKAGKCLQGSR